MVKCLEVHIFFKKKNNKFANFMLLEMEVIIF